MRTFKIIASKAGKVVFDDRVEAQTPREARDRMKQALGLASLTGVVYAVTEIPVDLIAEIVAAQIAGVETRLAALESGAAGIPPARFDPPAPTRLPAAGGHAPTKPDTEPIRAILGPNWKAIRRHYEATRSVKQTAAQFNVSPNTLKARIRRGGWGK